MNTFLSLKISHWTRSLLCAQTMLAPPIDTQVRYRTRRSTRLRKAAIKARIKAQKAAMPKKPPPLSFMQQVSKMLLKWIVDLVCGFSSFKDHLPPEVDIYGETVVRQTLDEATSLSLSWPSRLIKLSENLQRSEDDVFQISQFDCKVPIDQAIGMLRELYHKTIYDDPKAPVHMRLDLNMNLDIEKTDCIGNFVDMFVLPYPFEYGKRRVVMAFSKEPDAQMAAREAGAEFVGGTEIIRKIRRGEFKIDEVDYFVSNIDLLQELTTIRGLLKDKMPTQNNGLIGLDVVPLVRHYRNAITIEVKQDEQKTDWGVCSTLIGRLDMSDEQLAANAAAMLEKICAKRPLAKSLGHMVHRSVLTANERRTFVEWDFAPFVPRLPDNDSALQALADEVSGKKSKKKKKRKTQQLVV